MGSQLQKTLLHGPRAEQSTAAASYLGFLLALVPSLAAFFTAISQRQWTTAGGWGFLLLSLGMIGLAVVARRRPEVPPANVVFQPFVDVADLRPWPRHAEVIKLRAKLADPQCSLSLVVGESGAGKTVLLKRILRDKLAAEGVRCFYFDTYAAFRGNLEEQLSLGQGVPPAEPRDAGRADSESDDAHVVILDQFEQYLASVQSLAPHERDAEQSWLFTYLEAARERGWQFVISVREEWYYDLRWLKGLVPSPSECVHVAGPSPSDTEDLGRRAIVGRFKRVLGDDSSAEPVVAELSRGGSLLPIEVQIVGATLERERLRGHKVGLAYLRDFLGGIDGAVNRYFDGVLAGAEDRRVALKILCALSARTRFRRQQDLGDIVERLFEDRGQVRTAVAYLHEQGLLVERDTTRYELAHDYLAGFFYQKSGSELDPSERDNILFHMEGPDEGPRKSPVLQLRQTSSRPGGFAPFVIIPLFIMMTVRLLYLGIDWMPLGAGPRAQPLFGQLLDVNYVPIYIPHLAWAIYVGLLYERIFSRLNETLPGRVFSMLTVVNMALCVIAAIFIPSVWLASIAWGGFIVGLKLVSVSWKKDINSAARSRVRSLGLVTVANMAFLALLGVLGLVLSLLFVDTAGEARYWLIVNLVLASAMTYACYALAPGHVQRAAASQILGLLARSPGGVVPRMRP